MKLRIDEQRWDRLCKVLLARTDLESAGILLGEPIPASNGTVIAVREAIPVPDDAYRIRRPDQLSLDPVAFNRLTRKARDCGWSVFTIHTHPGASEPWFSAADDTGDARLMPSIHCQIPEAPHGSIVLIQDGQAVARVFDAEVASIRIEMRIVGRTLGETGSPSMEEEPFFSCQKLALGDFGQARLRNLRVGVVGLGGTGSLVSMQLAHLGVGELVLIDGDLVEESNLSRIVGASRDDVGRTYKVDVAARYAEALGFVRKIERIQEFFDARHEALVGGCDIVVCCVDRHTPRAMLNRIAYKWLLPIIDLGTAFRVDGAGTIVADAGRVVVVGPGRPCLGCWGHLDSHALRIEALSAEERQGQIHEGYIEGANEAQPSVIAFNTAVAGAAVTELLRIVTGFAGTEIPPLRLAFAFSEGTVRRNVLHTNPRCEICGDVSGIP